MKKIFSFIVLLAGVISFTSCGDDDATYTPVVPLEVSSTDVFFEANGGTGSIVINSKGTITAATSSSWITCSVSGNTVSVVAQENPSRDGRSALIKITSSDGATTNVTATQKGLVFGINGQSAYNVEGMATTITVGVYHISPVTVKSSVDWITATFNGETDEISIQIAENNTGAVRTGEIAIESAGMTEKIVITQNLISHWKSLGTGAFIDDFVISLFGYDPEPYFVEIEENMDTPGLYRLVDMYAGVVADFGEVGGYESIEVHAENPKGVYILEQPIGWDAGYGNMAIVTEGGDYVGYYGDFDFVYQNAPQLFGTLKDGVITFPAFERPNGNGIYQGYIIMGEDAYYAGMNGAIEIYLPSALQSSAKLKTKVETQKKALDFSRRLKSYNKATERFSKLQKGLK